MSDDTCNCQRPVTRSLVQKFLNRCPICKKKLTPETPSPDRSEVTRAYVNESFEQTSPRDSAVYENLSVLRENLDSLQPSDRQTTEGIDVIRESQSNRLNQIKNNNLATSAENIEIYSNFILEESIRREIEESISIDQNIEINSRSRYSDIIRAINIQFY